MTASKKDELPLWRYEREPAGMGEWCYGIYRMDVRMAYTEELAVAIVIVGGLNRDENGHSSQPVPCDDVTCYSTVLFELQKLLNYNLYKCWMSNNGFCNWDSTKRGAP